MKIPKPLFWIALFCFVSAVLLLLSGSEILLYEVIKKPSIPFGNISTALGLIAFPLVIGYALNTKKRKNKLSQILNILLVFGWACTVAWWPLGRFLSGNWRNSFVDRPCQSLLFWNYTYFVVGLLLFILLIHLLSVLKERLFRKS